MRQVGQMKFGHGRNFIPIQFLSLLPKLSHFQIWRMRMKFGDERNLEEQKFGDERREEFGVGGQGHNLLCRIP